MLWWSEEVLLINIEKNLGTKFPGVYLLGLADVVYKLDFIQSFAFGSLISAVDPVATLAIFQGIICIQSIFNTMTIGNMI